MRVTCKNTLCKHYYELKQGQHCPAEVTCERYTANKKKADANRIKCKDCEYCKKIYTKAMTEYHWECTANGVRRLILMIDNRTCDCRR